MIEVTVEVMKKAKAYENELWCEYIHDVDPDHRQYLSFSYWLALRILEHETHEGGK